MVEDEVPVLLFELEPITFASAGEAPDDKTVAFPSQLADEVDVMVDELFDEEDCRVSLENGVLYEIRTTLGSE